MSLTAEQLLAAYHDAMVAADADAFAELYADDGVHEFPFFSPYGVTRLQGPDQIRDFYRPLWGRTPIAVQRVQSVAIHRTQVEGVVVDELVSVGHRRTDGAPFRLAGLLVLTARDGKIVNTRDYMDLFGLQHQLSAGQDAGPSEA